MKSTSIFTYILAVLLATPLFHTCCGTVDCDGSDNSAYFRLLSEADSTDLFFGQDPKYQVEQTKFFGLDNGDTIHLTHNLIDYLQDTFLRVDFGFDLDTAYIQYDDGDIDTFSVFRKTTESDCCGTIVKAEELTFNDSPRLENEFPYIVLLK